MPFLDERLLKSFSSRRRSASGAKSMSGHFPAASPPGCLYGPDRTVQPFYQELVLWRLRRRAVYAVQIKRFNRFIGIRAKAIGNAVENAYEEMLGFAQTHQGFALDPPPFEKGGPEPYCLSTAMTTMPFALYTNGISLSIS